MKKNIVWLASFPKSGNTWMRIFLANYLANTPEPLSINQVHRFGIGDSIVKTYRIIAPDFDPSDYRRTFELRDKVLRGITNNNADVNFVKTHNMRAKGMGRDLIPAEYTRLGIYIIRNPLDVVLSYSRHFGLTIEDTVDAFAREDNATDADESTVAQLLGSWSMHVNSWERGLGFPKIVVRYEDMTEKPEETFGEVLKSIGIPIDEERLQRAIRFSSFDELSKQEEKTGFAERSLKTERFFAKGKTGQWRTDLPEELISKIRRDHKRVMKRHGYYSV